MSQDFCLGIIVHSYNNLPMTDDNVKLKLNTQKKILWYVTLINTCITA